VNVRVHPKWGTGRRRKICGKHLPASEGYTITQ